MKSNKEDLQIKLGTPEEAVWTEILEREENNLINNRINQKIAEKIIKLAKTKIAAEEAKRSKK